MISSDFCSVPNIDMAIGESYIAQQGKQAVRQASKQAVSSRHDFQIKIRGSLLFQRGSTSTRA